MKKLKMGALLKESFAILKQNFNLLFLGIMAGVPGLFMGEEMNLNSYLWLVVSIFISVYCIGLVIKYLYDLREGTPLMAEVNDFVLKKYFPLLATYLIFLAIVMFGFVLLVIPGLFLLVRFGLCDYGVLLEGENVFQSIGRSWRITKGSWWRIAGLTFIASLPYFLVVPFKTILPEAIFSFVSFFVGAFVFVLTQIVFFLVYMELREN